MEEKIDVDMDDLILDDLVIDDIDNSALDKMLDDDLLNDDLLTGGDHVFVENPDIKLQSAVSFAQYVLNNKLITIIGEYHEREFGCQDGYKTITIADYALNILRTNVNSRVLLEIDPDFIDHERKWPKSAPIREILKRAPPKVRGRITGYDYRNWWIGADNREMLYHDTAAVYRLNTRQIIDMYITPFFSRVQAFMATQISPGNYTNERQLDLISIRFPRDIDDHLRTLEKAIQYGWELKPDMTVQAGMHKTPGRVLSINGKNATILLDINSRRVVIPINTIKLKVDNQYKTIQEFKVDIIEGLRHVWKKVTDWSILIALFHKSSGNEMITIMGEQHSKNIIRIFKDIPPVTKQEGKQQGDCVSLLQTISITDINKYM